MKLPLYDMGVSSLPISAVFTVLSFIGLQFWTELSFTKIKTDGLSRNNLLHDEGAWHALELLLSSYATTALVVNFVINIFILIILSLKTLFFWELHAFESRKLVERLVNYVIYKGTFLPLVVPPSVVQVGTWSIWLIVLCTLKMFQAVARDRLERLNSSPSATPRTYFRVYCVLLLVISLDAVWIKMCLLIYRRKPSSLFLLLFFEPLSIAFETLQAILVHGVQLLDIWLYHSAVRTKKSRISKLIDISAAGGSLWEWKSVLSHNLGFFLDVITLLMALGHYVHIWWLHGIAVNIVDALLFLNIRALLSAVARRTKGFIKFQAALGTLNGALPDATSEEIKAYDDECAICREAMTKAKKLSCNHLFHLSCLRSWLDQGLRENYSCPTCRKPLFVVPHPGYISSDEQLARRLSFALEWQNPPAAHILPSGFFPNQMHNQSEHADWRGPRADTGWFGGTSMRSCVGLGRVMRRLAVIVGTYAQTSFDDAVWNLWPSQAAITSASNVSSIGMAQGYLTRFAPRLSDDDIANMLAMAETVREVLPHVPDELIFQDLQRTNSVSITVNNLLQM